MAVGEYRKISLILLCDPDLGVPGDRRKLHPSCRMLPSPLFFAGRRSDTGLFEEAAWYLPSLTLEQLDGKIRTLLMVAINHIGVQLQSSKLSPSLDLVIQMSVSISSQFDAGGKLAVKEKE